MIAAHGRPVLALIEGVESIPRGGWGLPHGQHGVGSRTLHEFVLTRDVSGGTAAGIRPLRTVVV